MRPVSALLAAVLTVSVVGGVSVAQADSASAAAPAGPIVVNEVETSADWVELTNISSAPVDISGYQIRDDRDAGRIPFTIPAGTSLAPGAFFTADVNAGADGFGLGQADSARLFAADGTTLLDQYSWTGFPTVSWGRCPNGTGDFVDTVAASKNATNVCSVDPAAVVRINEIVSSGGSPDDWIELTNTGTVSVDAGGLVLRDDDDTHSYVIPAGTTIAAGGYAVVEKGASGFSFGLGAPDAVRLFASNGSTLVDQYAWTAHASTAYGRCADRVGSFTTVASVTKGAANACTPPSAVGSVVVNEVESNGDDTDWVELYNAGGTAVDLSGSRFRDNDDTRVPYVLPAGSTIAPGGFFVIDQKSGSNPNGFDFGLGSSDQARLFGTDGATLIASYSWTQHAGVTYGRCPDGTGNLRETTVSTKGAANNCSTPLRINEIESQNGTPGDWIELKNVGAQPVDPAGLVVRDSGTTGYVIPAGTTIAPGGYLVLDEGDGTTGFPFGLGGSDSVRLFEADGTTLLDQYSWTAHAATTYGRCPDGTGTFAATTAATRGQLNQCPGILPAQSWPGGQSVRALDSADTFTGDLSGLDWEPSGSSAPGTLWAVQNGSGLLYRIVSDGQGGWAPAAGWSAGRTLGYPGGEAGVVDAEGVTVTSAGSAGGVYVSTERNNAASSVSRPSVLRVDPTASGSGPLVATREWNLLPDFPGLGANAGLEGITWVPDSFLVAGGFVDQRTGSVYTPSSYPGHGSGLFFVGVEGTASVYAYALNQDGSFARIATIDARAGVQFSLVADVQFDPDRGALWVVCDEACDGRIAEYRIDAHGAFVPSVLFDRPSAAANYANEGFAVADDSQCSAGVKPTFYADDNDTDGFSLRTGTIECTGGASGGGGSNPSPSNPGAGQPGSGGQTSAPAPVASERLTAASRGGVDGPARVGAGATVTLFVGLQYAGQTVHVYVYSTPVYLGSAVVDAFGRVTVTLPAGVPSGEHRLAVLDASGALIGWDDVTVTGTTAGRLASAGVAGSGALGVASALLLLGALVVAGAARTRRRSAS